VIERAGGVAHNQTAGGYSVPCGNFLYKFLTSIYIYIHTHTHTHTHIRYSFMNTSQFDK